MQTLARQSSAVFACAVAVCSFAACSDSDDDDASEGGNTSDMTFFVTSTTQDGDLGGLEGADQICDDLATAVGAGDHEWRAYLSAEDDGNGSPVNARDRIGNGPWINAAGVTLADSLEELHSASMVGNAELFINEKRERINGQWNGSNGMDGAAPNQHDVMTGSDSNGMLLITEMTTTCADWTSNTMEPGPQVGHTDGMGPMMNTAQAAYTSWNGGHAAAGCSQEGLEERGGAGKFYCFAADD
jgi:hypothetical protein